MTTTNLNSLPEKELLPGYHVRFVHGEHMTLAYWRIEAGAALPDHSHVHEQILSVLEGEFEATVNGVTERLSAGMVSVIPGGVRHSGVAITACRIIDAFHPVREEYRSL